MPALERCEWPRAERILFAMRWLVLAVFALGCSDTLHDPVELLAARAPADAIDCGHVTGWDGQPVADAHACAAGALADHVAFRVVIDQAVADGRLAIGWWAGPDGAGARMTYDAIYSAFGDDETVDWTPCAAVRAVAADCETLRDDLCLACE